MRFAISCRVNLSGPEFCRIRRVLSNAESRPSEAFSILTSIFTTDRPLLRGFMIANRIFCCSVILAEDASRQRTNPFFWILNSEF